MAAPTQGTQQRQLIRVENPARSGAFGFAAALGFVTLMVRLGGARLPGSDRSRASSREGDRGALQVTLDILRQACGLREAFTATKLSVMLFTRTAASMWVAQHWGLITHALVRRQFGQFRALTVQFAGMTLALSVLNGLLKYYINLLKVELRERITSWCHEEYLKPNEAIFYKANRVGERIERCDHRIVSDVERFSQVFSEVFSQSLKPCADFFVYSVELSRVQGITTPLALYAWFSIAHLLSRATRVPFSELAATDQRLEGEFRGRHADLIANCEQIAFLGGEDPERRVLDRHLAELIDHNHMSNDVMFKAEVAHQYLDKYFVTVIGLALVARPLLDPSAASFKEVEIASYFTSTWRNMEAFAFAIKEIFALSRRFGHLSGFAFRVSKLMEGLVERPPVLVEELARARHGPYPPVSMHGDCLEFQHVSIYKPDGALLVKDLSFKIERGQRVLVTGDNGCGKSSLFRVLRGLWPLVEGTITLPEKADVHFMAQLNFVPVGTLRDLITYPKSRADVEAEGRTDKEVHQALAWAHVSPRVLADGRAQLEFSDNGAPVRPKLDDLRDWHKELSPGQKQRIGFARLFYHRPAYVVLDECTNGISPDVEHDLYDRCTKLNLAVFSISHKNELRLFHDFELHFKGDREGSWAWSRCSEIDGKIVRASAMIKLPARVPGETKMESRITYERHVWFAE